MLAMLISNFSPYRKSPLTLLKDCFCAEKWKQTLEIIFPDGYREGQEVVE